MPCNYTKESQKHPCAAQRPRDTATRRLRVLEDPSEPWWSYAGSSTALSRSLGQVNSDDCGVSAQRAPL